MPSSNESSEHAASRVSKSILQAIGSASFAVVEEVLDLNVSKVAG